jgi:hypothetical protein
LIGTTPYMTLLLEADGSHKPHRKDRGAT